MAFDPRTIAGLESWFDASALTGLADGDPVPIWPDSSGNGRHATQGVGTKQPIYKAAFQNGLGVVRFDGIDDHLPTSYGPNFGNFTIFVVAKTSLLSNNRILDKDYVTGTWIGCSGITKLGGGVLESSAPYGLFTTVTNNEFHIVLSKRIVTRHLISADGNSPVENVVSSNALSSSVFCIGGKNGGSDVHSGEIAEILIFSHAISELTTAAVEGYLAWKWGTTSLLPVNHPYKSHPPHVVLGADESPSGSKAERTNKLRREREARQRDDEESIEAVLRAFAHVVCR